MSSFTELLKDQKEADRLAKYVVQANPNISDFAEFESALKKAFSQDARGQGALNFLNDEESKLIFESNVIQKTLKDNAGEEYAEVQEQGNLFEVQRRVAKGEMTKRSDIYVVPVQRRFVSHTKTGKEYNRGYMKFTSAERRFIQVRKGRNMETKKIIYEYNQHFKGNTRTESSIKTKIYRV